MNKPGQTIAQLISVGETQHVAGMLSEGSNVNGSVERLEAARTWGGRKWHPKGLKLRRTAHSQKRMDTADCI